MSNFIRKGIEYHTNHKSHFVVLIINRDEYESFIMIDKRDNIKITMTTREEACSKSVLHTYPNENDTQIARFYYYPTNYPQEQILAMLNSDDIETRAYVKALLENENYED